MSVAQLVFITHPEVVIDAGTPIEEWGLSGIGRRRAEVFARSSVMSEVTAIWSSAERKATDTAAILAEPLGLSVQLDARLGENDRSATGFLPPDVFEAAADAFFAQPKVSFRGWETAQDAQLRIVGAVREIVAGHTGGDLAIVAHGAVGTLLYCALTGVEISRDFDQAGQGHYWVADLSDLTPKHHWISIS